MIVPGSRAPACRPTWLKDVRQQAPATFRVRYMRSNITHYSHTLF